MSEIKKLRQDLENLLKDHLGTYKLPDKSTIPSIWVIGDRKPDFLNGLRNGIECIIYDTPNSTYNSLFGKSKLKSSQYTVILRRWSGLLEEAIDAIALAFDGVQVQRTPLREIDGVIQPEQARLTIPIWSRKTLNS